MMSNGVTTGCACTLTSRIRWLLSSDSWISPFVPLISNLIVRSFVLPGDGSPKTVGMCSSWEILMNEPFPASTRAWSISVMSKLPRLQPALYEEPPGWP